MNIELLWFEGCPNHETAEAILHEALAARGLDVPIQRIDVENEETGKALIFPGSPTIRINGQDVEPGWEPCEDCTPRCRLYFTSEGLRGLPEREWIERALDSAFSN